MLNFHDSIGIRGILFVLSPVGLIIPIFFLCE